MMLGQDGQVRISLTKPEPVCLTPVFVLVLEIYNVHLAFCVPAYAKQNLKYIKIIVSVFAPKISKKIKGMLWVSAGS